jgi:hypothetical protein
MRTNSRLAAVPERVYLVIFFGIFLVAALSAYFIREDADLLVKQIHSKQRDLSRVLLLRDAYENKKHESERSAPGTVDSRALSLALVEETVTKSFVGGSLLALQPAKTKETTKEEKGSKRMAVEVKVAGAALGEVVSFVKALESAGFRVEKLRLSLPASNPSTVDMQATITERRSHG